MESDSIIGRVGLLLWIEGGDLVSACYVIGVKTRKELCDLLLHNHLLLLHVKHHGNSRIVRGRGRIGWRGWLTWLLRSFIHDTAIGTRYGIAMVCVSREDGRKKSENPKWRCDQGKQRSKDDPGTTATKSNKRWQSIVSSSLSLGVVEFWYVYKDHTILKLVWLMFVSVTQRVYNSAVANTTMKCFVGYLLLCCVEGEIVW